MNRFLYVMLITLITLGGFTMYTHHDLGSITIQFSDFSFTTNLLVASAALLCVLFASLLVARAFQLIKSTFIYLFGQREIRRQNRAKAAFNRGLLEYTEGRFMQAEKTLLSYIQYSDNPLPAYLAAAKAAHRAGNFENRDSYLRKARELAPKAELAIGITQAQLQLDYQQNEQALATLQQLNHQTPGHFLVLQLLASTCHRLEDWDSLYQLMPELKKHGQTDDKTILAYEVAIHRGRMKLISQLADFSQLHDYWLQISKPLKNLPEIVIYYTHCLVKIDHAGEAEAVLRHTLNTNWHDSMMDLYAELDVVVDQKVLATLESWLQDHPQNTHLLLALGKTCLHLSLWGKARNYLEASLSLEALPETYLRLARLLEEHMHEPDAAAEYYRQGLHSLAGNYNEAMLNTDRPPASTAEEPPRLKIVKQ